MDKFKTTVIAVLASLCQIPAAGQDMKVETLANDNFIIRIAPGTKERYLILPIEEAAPESQVKVIADNVQVRRLSVRLAQNKVDYFVPFDLKEFSGRHLVLFTHSGARPDGGAAFLKNVSLSDTFDTSNREKFRPDYHHTPAYGWMNDPNGMFYKNGEWHLCYQFGPYGSMWNNMTWGHSVSKDLIHWEHRSPVLSPNAHGTVFSGSCIVDKDNTAGFGNDAVIAMYTSAGDVQSQSIAYSLDNGDTFRIYEGNPVLTADIADFRDPNMFWNDAIGKWNLIMSAGQEMRLYSSPDMKRWTEESRFGKGLGCHDGVWECPDLMKLKVETGKAKGQERWVLICNTNPGGPAGGSATQYFIGDFNGHRFTVDDESRYRGKALWQDYGKDHYATVSFSNAPDGRHTMMAWMSNWQYANNVPTMQYRSSNSIAREPFLYEGKDYSDPKNPSATTLFLGSRPAPEYDGKGLDRQVRIKGSCRIILSNDEGEEFAITYDEKNMTLTADRSKSGLTDFSRDFSVPATAPVRRKLTSARIFIDNSSVEFFGNNGEVCLTSLVFPQSKYNRITVSK